MPRTIWLASYPKSGNTWLRMLIANLSADSKPVDINGRLVRGPAACAREPFEQLTLLDTGLLTHDEIDCLRPRVYEELARDAVGEDEAPRDAAAVRFCLAHDAYELTPKGEPLLGGRDGADGAILIVRDPRDVAPSLANHMRVGIDTAIKHINNERRMTHDRPGQQQRLFRQRPRGWSQHARSWLEQRDIPVHMVRYEDLKADTIGAFGRALAFAGEPADAAVVRRAVAFSDFAELRGQELRNGFSQSPQQPGGPFFRRGEAGAWRDELSAEQVARVEKAHGPMMRRLGYGPEGALPLARA